ncbi:DegT/DnrJ/EryC1/StrS family aminotransferase [candidate division KSB1 bacterium]|nr:DegT/DnrJ/EryC1/StrS family aminotransferase [candidate division KSB1 bacterium]
MAVLAINGGQPTRTKQFPSWPVWDQEEIKNLTEVLESGKWGSLHGQKTSEFEKLFADYQQAKHGILVNSGTTALRLALTAAGVEAGSEVIVPAYTFIATATAVVDMGGVPIFVDIDPDTYNIDPALAGEAVTERTAAIMPVHFAGRSADMDKIMALAQKYDLKVIEDAAQAWGSEWKGKRVGAIGQAGCFSFQSSKNISAGEGGIILTNDDLIAKMARSHNNCGRSDDGQWYEHYFFGGNTRITEFQSAILLAQFSRYEKLKKIRQDNFVFLNNELRKIDGIEPLIENPSVTSHSAHLFIFRYKKDHFSAVSKQNFIEAMRKEGIPTSPGYSIPLYHQPVFKNRSFGPHGKTVDFPVDYSTVSCPETERACFEEAIWFTQNILLGSRDDMRDIVAAVLKIQQYSDEIKNV